MKSGFKGFWKKQKNVVRRHRPLTIGHRYIEWQFDYLAGIPSCEPKNLYGVNYGKKY